MRPNPLKHLDMTFLDGGSKDKTPEGIYEVNAGTSASLGGPRRTNAAPNNPRRGQIRATS
ncbi:MAG: hypothetical protein U0744_03740 [Gemmataceae bacterium]